MRVLIDINHPAHVHLFKNFAWKMQERGHKVLFTTRKKEISHILLENLGFEHIVFGKHYKKTLGKLWGIFKFDTQLLNVSLRFKPDIFISMGSIYGSHAAMMVRKPNILLQDTEHASLQHKITVPFCDVMLNPVCFHRKLTEKQMFYQGYHELAYLHKNYFTPDPGILKELGVEEGEKFTIVRLVSWNASHDVGHSGLTVENKIKAVQEFAKLSKVFITSEDELPAELKQYQIKILPEKIHDALYYASLLYGESATMASECAMLGTPSIFLDNDGRGYTDELEEKYQLVFNFTESPEDQMKSIEKGIEILSHPDLKMEWRARTEKMLSEKIDVTAFLVWFVEQYPQSLTAMKENPEVQYQFQ
ncbi:MAG: DUF354 domain-containing protein [Bacteroidetes bacterium]|nr:DUF354 domain-containing protein [Bacteroidota bacterium]